MFGMLDYRAHKLYWVLVFPVVFVLFLFAVFCLPLFAYLISAKFVTQLALQFLLAVIVLFLLGIPWFFVVKVLVAVPVGLFNFLIDPEPADGRTKDEAKLVVADGNKAIVLLKFGRPAYEWTDEDIERLATLNFTTRLFQTALRERLFAIREYYLDHPDVMQNEYNTKKFLAENGLSIGWFESVVTNPVFRTTALQYAVLLVLFSTFSL
jgi:hypothetical protein